jgi:CheY-like chemotaxis protein
MDLACEPDKPCILLIDDDADLIAFLFDVLVNEGFTIVAASNGQHALDLLEHGLRPNIILVDLMLPRVSGMDLLTHIRTDPELRNIPRIVITGASDRTAVIADRVFAKPFDHETLVKAIHSLIEINGQKRRTGARSHAVAHDQQPARTRRRPHTSRRKI